MNFNGEERARLNERSRCPFARRVAREFCILSSGLRVAAGAIGELTDEVVPAHLRV